MVRCFLDITDFKRQLRRFSLFSNIFFICVIISFSMVSEISGLFQKSPELRLTFQNLSAILVCVKVIV
jgi:hypothetical protein